MLFGQTPVLLYDAERVEGRRERGSRVDRRDDAHDVGEHRPTFHVALGEGFPGTQTVIRASVFGQVGDDLGSHPAAAAASAASYSAARSIPSSAVSS